MIREMIRRVNGRIASSRLLDGASGGAWHRIRARHRSARPTVACRRSIPGLARPTTAGRLRRWWGTVPARPSSASAPPDAWLCAKQSLGGRSGRPPAPPKGVAARCSLAAPSMKAVGAPLAACGCQHAASRTRCHPPPLERLACARSPTGDAGGARRPPGASGRPQAAAVQPPGSEDGRRDPEGGRTRRA